MAESGLSVELFDLTQVYQGVADGGLQQSWSSAVTAICVLLTSSGRWAGLMACR